MSAATATLPGYAASRAIRAAAVGFVLWLGLSHAPYAKEFPPQGGSGGGPFRVACDSFVVGFEGRSGAYIDQVRLVCGVWDEASRQIRRTGAVHVNIGESTGGGPVVALCPDGWAVKLIDFANTWRNDKQDGFVHHINFVCVSGDGAQSIGRTFGPTKPVENYKFFLGGELIPGHTVQECPPGELAKGLSGRSGLYVDALGLICAAIPKAPVISPNLPPRTTLQGVQPSPGKQAIINTLPPGPAPAPPPQAVTAPAPAPAKHSGFTGTWDSRTDKGWSYVIALRQDGRNVSGTYVAQNGDKGKINGRVKDDVLEFKWEQDGGFKGTGQFALAADGNSFSGSYRTDPNRKVTDPSYLQGIWNGTRR